MLKTMRYVRYANIVCIKQILENQVSYFQEVSKVTEGTIKINLDMKRLLVIYSLEDHVSVRKDKVKGW